MINLPKKALFPVFLVILLLPMFIHSSSSPVQTLVDNSEQSSFSAFNYTSGLEILNDTAFELLNFEGNGTEAFPFLITDYNLVEDNHAPGIKIIDTTKFCVIANCTISLYLIGISLLNATNVVVSNNIIDYSSGSIDVNNCSNIEIVENTISNSYGAIDIDQSPGSIIEENTITSQFTGIRLFNSPNCLINDNIINLSSEGLGIYDSPGAIITNNDFTHGGIQFRSDDHQLEDYLSYTVENNTLNSEEIGFFKNIYNIDIDENIYGQLILINCSSIFVIDLEFSDCITGLSAYYGDSIIVVGCTFTNNLEGSIVMYFVDDPWIHSVSISESSSYPGGILLYGCSSGDVQENTFTNCNSGIQVSYSKSLFIENNIMEGCYSSGISIHSSNNIIIENNKCTNGSNIESGRIFVSDSYDCNIENNVIEDNKGYGILFYNASYCLIAANIIRNNHHYGVFLNQYTSNNIIYRNEFVDNCLGDYIPNINSQAKDSGSGNKWFSDFYNEGNYWNEHISNAPYDIDGEAEAQDPYPLKKSPFETNMMVPFFLISVILLLTTQNKRKKIRISSKIDKV
ncbi:MAG: hypothetical protein HeimAB125_23520 [Candidatus Heimdallarchaeota archaeon AB_125]|nr:MAG: hypothetical protein HeimAB125_23520 [Candidatus Heimdallarchaeota archaeon AB_125]